MRKLLLSIVVVLCCHSVAAQEADYYSSVPLPRSISVANSIGFTLDSNCVIVIPAGDDEMHRIASMLQQYVKEMTRNNVMITDGKKTGKGISKIILRVDNKIKDSEAYTMEVRKGRVEISGGSHAGVFYGVQTLRKSLPVLKEPSNVSLPAVNISDSPRFPYRGMHLDCSRHFFSVDFVKQYIDMLSLHGMNRFHWHLTDDQGWRVEIRKYPKLTQVGGFRSGTVVGRNSTIDDGVRYGGYYTRDEIRDIVKYASERYITIIPEIDMPGHTLAALTAYPELGCTGGPYDLEHHWGVFADVLCPGKESTFKFVEDVLDELIQLFPSEYIHIGGDECPRDRWIECADCQNRIAKEGLTAKDGAKAEDRLQGYFTTRIQNYLAGKGRKIIGWDELLDCDVETSATIMSWRGGKPGIKGAKLGHDVIMSPYNPMYFNLYQTHVTNNEPLLHEDCSTVKDVYDYEPFPEGISEDVSSHIIGVQANMWTEYILYPSVVEYQALPRMAALSEVQWCKPDSKDFDAFKQRVTHLRDIYQMYGWTVAPHLWRNSDK